MTASTPNRVGRLAALLTVTVAVGVLVVAVGACLPESWWPRSGKAFTSSTAGGCDRIAGPARAYCERGRHVPGTRSAQAAEEAAAWKLLPSAAAVGALVIWWRRVPVRPGRG